MQLECSLCKNLSRKRRLETPSFNKSKSKIFQDFRGVRVYVIVERFSFLLFSVQFRNESMTKHGNPSPDELRIVNVTSLRTRLKDLTSFLDLFSWDSYQIGRAKDNFLP